MLVGWSFGDRRIEQIAPGLPVMTGLTAVGLACAGASLLLGTVARDRSRADGGLVWCAAVLGGISAVIGALVLVEYLIAPIGIDQLLFTATGHPHPGRPSPQTAVALVCLGAALATIGLSGRRRWLHRVLLAAGGGVVMFVLIGYLYGAEELRGLAGIDGMAVHTLGGFIVLVAGILVAEPKADLDALLRGTSSQSIIVRTMLGVCLVPVAAGVVFVFAEHDGFITFRVALSLFTITMIAVLGLAVVLLFRQIGQAEHGSRQATGQLRALFDNVPAGLALRDLAGRYLQVNEYGAGILGRTPEQLVGRRAEDASVDLEASVSEAVGDDDRTITRSARSVDREQRIRQADGTVHDYRVVRYPVIEDGNVAAFGTFIVDITEQKRTIAALQLAETRFRSAFDAAPIGMMVQALDGRIDAVNPALCQLLGRTPESVLRRGVVGFVAPRDTGAERAARAALLEPSADASLTLDLRFDRRGGPQATAEVHLTLVRGPDGEPQHFLAQVLDITERQAQQRRLEYLADRDPLTGVLNRRAFERALARHTTDERRRGEPGSLILIDLDGLKQVNDSRGHEAGDEMICRAAKVCVTHLRSSDIIARLGGDEFAALLPGTPLSDAETVARGLLAAFNAAIDQDTLLRTPIRASVGVGPLAGGDPAPGVTEVTGAAGIDVEPSDPAVAALKRADLAMYEAKRDGGNRICVATVAPGAASH